MRYEDRFRSTHEAIANLEEIASSEALLLAEERLEPGLPISFCAKGRHLYGKVESSAFHPILGWFVKVTLDPDSRWHGGLFVPEHFIALCASSASEATETVCCPARA